MTVWREQEPSHRGTNYTYLRFDYFATSVFFPAIFHLSCDIAVSLLLSLSLSLSLLLFFQMWFLSLDRIICTLQVKSTPCAFLTGLSIAQHPRVNEFQVVMSLSLSFFLSLLLCVLLLFFLSLHPLLHLIIS